jgi:hypothetical protein
MIERYAFKIRYEDRVHSCEGCRFFCGSFLHRFRKFYRLLQFFGVTFFLNPFCDIDDVEETFENNRVKLPCEVRTCPLIVQLEPWLPIERMEE